MSHDHHRRHPHAPGPEHRRHAHDATGHELTPAGKLATLLEHWIRHNGGHAQAYREWAATARGLAMEDVAAALDEAAELTLAANGRFAEALKRLEEAS